VRPQTIQIYLPQGTPRGLRVAEITTRIVRVIEVPRSELNEFLRMPEAQQVGVYFLVGDVDDEERAELYIGQSGCVGDRLKEHNRNKDFWVRAFAVVSLTNNLTQTHALFLEWFSIEAAGRAGRYRLLNGNLGSRPFTPAPLEADCHEIHETAGTLLATLGQPVFEAFVDRSRTEDAEASEAPRVFCRRPQAEAAGIYTSEGLVVLEGSLARKEISPSSQGTSAERFRERLVESGLLVPHDEAHYRFSRDHPFASPSMAAVAVLGRHANGWTEWRDAGGRTLDELIRQAGAGEQATKYQG
jgi:hypothetical protein